MITSKGDPKMSHRRAKTSGWAAFDQQHRQINSGEARPSNEPFPLLPSAVQPTQSISRKKHLKVKSFSSVILPSVDFPPPLQDNTKSKPSAIGSSEGRKISEISPGIKVALIFRQLKELFGWADDSLIEDIMTAAGNDFDKASSFLKAMVSSQSSQEHNTVGEKNYSCDSTELMSNDKLMHEKKDVLSKEISKPTKTWFDLEPCIGNNNEYVKDEFISAEELYNDCTEINKLLGHLTCVPVEPEWEEDDVYLTRRKDAIKMMRAASRHSRAATNSFLRGDHISSQQFSLKAREEWRTAQNLNAKAACEILSIRNENNGIWRLDLHGLHVSEAVQAVKERLNIIETQLLSEGSRPSEFPNSFKDKAEVGRALYPKGCNNLEKSDEQTSHKLKPILLEVITGIGNHSRGGAALPAAIRSFLSDNRYWFDETRPGVITVRPKFRPVK